MGAVLVLFWVGVVPFEPGFEDGGVGGGEVGIDVFGAKLPIFFRHFGDGVVEVIAVGFVGKVGAVDAAADNWEGLVDTQAFWGAEPARPGGFDPGYVDFEVVQWVLRVHEVEPFAGEVCGYFAPGEDGAARWGSCWEAEENGRRSWLIHTKTP